MFHVGCKMLAHHKKYECVNSCSYAQFVVIESVFYLL